LVKTILSGIAREEEVMSYNLPEDVKICSSETRESEQALRERTDKQFALFDASRALIEEKVRQSRAKDFARKGDSCFE
jgi:hypothetical protein